MRVLLAALLMTSPLWAGGATLKQPSYTTEGVVNAASYSASSLAPNTIASVFGSDLSYETRAVSAFDLRGGELPTSLGGVTVYVNGVAAAMFYVSPNQVNFLIPSVLLPGECQFYVVRQSIVGPKVKITLNEAGPAMFQDGNNNVIATHVDGSPVSVDSPASPGEWVVAYSAGLGRTSPDARNYLPATVPAPLQHMENLSITIDGKPLARENIYYAGLTPGFAGLYQINLRLPDDVAPNPEVRVFVLDHGSIENRRLLVR